MTTTNTLTELPLPEPDAQPVAGKCTAYTTETLRQHREEYAQAAVAKALAARPAVQEVDERGAVEAISRTLDALEMQDEFRSRCSCEVVIAGRSYVWSGERMVASGAHAGATAQQAAAQAESAGISDGTTLWLWKNGDHFLAFTHLYPCFTPGGDPMTLGEPFGRAVFRVSHDRAQQAVPTPTEQPPRFLRVLEQMRFHGQLTDQGFEWLRGAWEEQQQPPSAAPAEPTSAPSRAE